MNDDLETRKAKAVEEYQTVMEWSVYEMGKVMERLKENNAWEYLDGNKEAFAYIKEKRQQRLKEILEKYNLPNELIKR